GRIVPRIVWLALERFEFGNLGILIRSGAHQRQFAVIAHDDQVAARKQHLTVSVTATFPLALAAVDIDAGENALVKPVNKPLMKNRAIELVLHVYIFPDGASGEALAATLYLHQCGSFAVA